MSLEHQLLLHDLAGSSEGVLREVGNEVARYVALKHAQKVALS